jgi:hypothetical protein
VFNKVSAIQVQTALRQAFACWGLPEQLGLDNGLPWGGWNDLPTALALWLVGLGIRVNFLPPGQKQLNGVVERSQGTGQRWCEPATCATAQELQNRLEEMDRIQREEYPSFPAGSRQTVFPQLQQVKRPYTRAWEEEHWDLSLAQQYLSGHTALRRANKQGQVSVYAHRYSMGAKQRRKAVQVYYDPGAGEWVFVEEASSRLLRRYQAVEITRERIRTLQISS